MLPFEGRYKAVTPKGMPPMYVSPAMYEMRLPVAPPKKLAKVSYKPDYALTSKECMEKLTAKDKKKKDEEEAKKQRAFNRQRAAAEKAANQLKAAQEKAQVELDRLRRMEGGVDPLAVSREKRPTAAKKAPTSTITKAQYEAQQEKEAEKKRKADERKRKAQQAEQEKQQRKRWMEGNFNSDDDDDEMPMTQQDQREAEEKSANTCHDCKVEFTDDDREEALGCDHCDMSWWHWNCVEKHTPEGLVASQMPLKCDVCRAGC